MRDLRLVGLALALVCCAAFAATASADELSQIVSLEHPSFDVAASRMAVGRDGRVYARQRSLRPAREARRLRQARDTRSTYALQMVAANAEGVIATANAHFNHAVKLWTHGFQELGSVSDFLVSDQVDWQSPTDVEAGPAATSTASTRTATASCALRRRDAWSTNYSLDRLGEDLSASAQLRVWEKRQALLRALERRVESGGVRRSVALVAAHASGLWRRMARRPRRGPTMEGSSSSRPRATRCRSTMSRGDLGSRLRLQAGQSKGPASGSARAPWRGVPEAGRTPASCSRSTMATSGALKRVVLADTEELDVTLPHDPWTAGTPFPLAIRLVSETPRAAAGVASVAPSAGRPGHSRSCRFATASSSPPGGAGGLYQLRISAGRAGSQRRPTPSRSSSRSARRNRRERSRSTRLSTASTSARAKPSPSPSSRGRPPSCRIERSVNSTRGSRVVARERCRPSRRRTFPAGAQAGADAGAGPGRYELTAEAPGLTMRRAGARGGSGHRGAARSSASSSTGTTSTRSRRDRVRRAGEGRRPSRSGAQARREHVRRSPRPGLPSPRRSRQTTSRARLKSDPGATAPEKATLEGDRARGGGRLRSVRDRGAINPARHDARPAARNRLRPPERAAARGRDHARDDELSRRIPAFRGWSWAANWWIGKLGADAAAGPEEKAAYTVGPRERPRADGLLEPGPRHRVRPRARAGGRGGAAVPCRPAERSRLESSA